MSSPVITAPKALGSSVGQKVLMAISGLSLAGFLVTHLLGNLLLLKNDAYVFNEYSKRLHDLGPLLELAEWGLFGFFVIHAAMGIRVSLRNRAARPVGYAMERSKGGPGRSNLSSRAMKYSGIVLAVFVVVHVLHLAKGPGLDAGYVQAMKDGGQTRDVYRLVREIFMNPMWVGFYVASMGAVILHLRHAVWSALQSLSLMKPSWSNPLYLFSLLFALIIGGGFVVLPIYMFIQFGGQS